MKLQFAVAFFTFCAVAQAQQDYGRPATDAEQRMEQISRQAAETQTIFSDFRQIKNVTMMAQPQVGHGKFYFKRSEHKLCLDFAEPEGDKILITDNGFAITVRGRRTEMTADNNPAVAQLHHTIKACLTGDFKPLGDASDTKYYETDRTFTVVMTPSNKRVRRYMSEIILQFDKADNSLMMMKLTERSGNSAQYEYTNRRFNTDIPDNIFQ